MTAPCRPSSQPRALVSRLKRPQPRRDAPPAPRGAAGGPSGRCSRSALPLRRMAGPDRGFAGPAHRPARCAAMGARTRVRRPPPTERPMMTATTLRSPSPCSPPAPPLDRGSPDHPLRGREPHDRRGGRRLLVRRLPGPARPPDAIAAAVAGDEIWVADGLYPPPPPAVRGPRPSARRTGWRSAAASSRRDEPREPPPSAPPRRSSAGLDGDGRRYEQTDNGFPSSTRRARTGWPSSRASP